MLKGSALALLTAAAVCTGGSPAIANSTLSYGSGVVTIAADPGGGDLLAVWTPSSGQTRFALTGGTSFRQVNADPSACAPAAPTAVVTCTAPVNRILVSLDDGADRLTVSGSGAELVANLGSGNDTALLPGATGVSTVHGGEGADVLEGGPGSDRLDGGPEDDTLRVSEGGADEFTGGPGLDRLQTVVGRPIAVTLDDVPDDGAPTSGSASNVHADIEDVQGSDGGDSVVGSAAGNLFDGLGGNDLLDGRGGYDSYVAGPGNDVIRARDGLSEYVGCGEGADIAEVDDVDLVSECEDVRASADLRPDVDADGARKPGDCDDGNAAIRPGAPEVLDNRIDEDCDGSDAVNLDRDADGYPRPGDCDDNRSDVHPGGSEIPGNGADEDCNGTASPFPRLLANVVLSTTTTKRKTRVVAFDVIDVVGGERIDVRCKGRGCPYDFRSRTARKHKKLSLLRPFAKRPLRPNAVIVVRITRADGVAKEFTARIRRRAVRRSLGCITPPRRSARPCQPTKL